jgi:hypothetical protein
MLHKTFRGSSLFPHEFALPAAWFFSLFFAAVLSSINELAESVRVTTKAATTKIRTFFVP